MRRRTREKEPYEKRGQQTVDGEPPHYSRRILWPPGVSLEKSMRRKRWVVGSEKLYPGRKGPRAGRARPRTARFLTPPRAADIIFMLYLEVSYEKDLSAKYQKKEKEPRLQEAHEHPGRKGDNKEASAQRKEEVDRLRAHGEPQEEP